MNTALKIARYHIEINKPYESVNDKNDSAIVYSILRQLLGPYDLYND
jgi:hypothetical protein